MKDNIILVHNTLFKDMCAAAVVTCFAITQFSDRSSCIIVFCIKVMLIDVHIYHIIGLQYIDIFQPVSKNNVIVLHEVTHINS